MKLRAEWIPGLVYHAVELDFILKMDERHCKGPVVLPFIMVILMAVVVGWVLRMRKPVLKTSGIIQWKLCQN